MATTRNVAPLALSWRDRLRTVRSSLALVAVIVTVALLGFVVYDASGDWQQARNLRNDSVTGRYAGEDSLPLFVAAQAERKYTAAYVANPTPARKAALTKSRQQTDAGIRSFKHLSGTELKVSQRHKWSYVLRIYADLRKLDAIRDSTDRHVGSADEATGYYTGLLAEMVQFYQQLSAMDDPGLTEETRPLVGLFWASEGLSQEDAVIARARAAGRLTPAHRDKFAAAYGAQKVMYERWISPYLPRPERLLYDRIVAGSAWRQKHRIERAVISSPTRSGATEVDQLPHAVEGWDAAYGRVAGQIARLNQQRTQGLLAHGNERADEVYTQMGWKVGGSAFVVVLAATAVIVLNRRIVRGVETVRMTASAVAQTHLPAIVEDLMHGRAADLSVLPEALEHPVGEFEQIHHSIVLLAQEAAEAGLTVYQERRGFGQFAEGVGTRAVVVVGRKMLSLLEELQKQYGEDPQLLQQLYELDHLSVRVRRLLENLLVLSGGHLEHAHDQPVHIANVLADTSGESAGHGRVEHDFRAEAWIVPDAAGELTHLIAELVDNAATFSPKEFPVVLRSLPVAAGVVVEVEDRGQPLKAGQLAELNDRLGSEPLFASLADYTQQLGLFVVGKLCERLGVTVTLRASPYGGVLAIVCVPQSLVTTRAAPAEVTTPPVPAPEPPSAPSPTAVPDLPTRTPGTHVAQELRNDDDPGPPQPSRGGRTPENDQGVFGALQDINPARTSDE